MYPHVPYAVSPRAASVLIVASVLLLLTGCAAPRGAATGVTPPGAAAAEARIRAVVNDWRGAPYRFGGTGRDGLDCSAFMQIVYRDVYGLDLPRSTRGQVRAGAAVPHGLLRTGDLVFFRPGGRRHVGVYLGDGRFAHASTSQGVTVSRLDTAYWRDAFWTARRLVGTPPLAEGHGGW